MSLQIIECEQVAGSGEQQIFDMAQRNRLLFHWARPCHNLVLQGCEVRRSEHLAAVEWRLNSAYHISWPCHRG